MALLLLENAKQDKSEIQRYLAMDKAFKDPVATMANFHPVHGLVGKDLIDACWMDTLLLVAVKVYERHSLDWCPRFMSQFGLTVTETAIQGMRGAQSGAFPFKHLLSDIVEVVQKAERRPQRSSTASAANAGDLHQDSIAKSPLIFSRVFYYDGLMRLDPLQAAYGISKQRVLDIALLHGGIGALQVDPFPKLNIDNIFGVVIPRQLYH